MNGLLLFTRGAFAHLYLFAYSLLRPRIGARRRRSSVALSALGHSIISARDPDGFHVYYTVLGRTRLYWQDSGARGRVATVLRKYESGDCRVSPGDVVIDVGANVGEFALGASHAGGRVLAFDPDERVHSALSCNAGGGAVFRWFPFAIGQESGQVDFFVSSQGADSSIIEPEVHTGKVQVVVRSIDDLAQELGISRIDFLKIEAEGYEPEVLGGCSRMLPLVSKIAVDVSPERRGESPLQVVQAALDSAGFHTWLDAPVLFGIRK